MIFTFLLIEGLKHILFQPLPPYEIDRIILPHFKEKERRLNEFD